MSNHTYIFPKENLVLSYDFYHFWQGEYYNQDEVQAMVAAEVLEEEKKRKAEEEEMKAEIEAVEEQKKKRRRGPLVAA